ncbi:hypothetical protein [Microlunatus sp. Gsoil 973]|uniref:hypothetical protein n=1 Tax=Microlunatus sp. Gsoil 973 TaxID=2672569 RepID=UPI00351B53D9
MQAGDPGSTLELYRSALRQRHRLQADELLEWVDVGQPEVLAFRRPNGWLSVTNFGATPVPLPDGELLLSSAGGPGNSSESGPEHPSRLAGYATAWLQQ